MLANASLTNSSYCDAVDAVLEVMSDVRTAIEEEGASQASGILFAAATMALSAVLVFFGGVLFRFAAAAAAAAVSFYFAYGFARSERAGVSCEVGLIGAAVAALMAGGVAACLWKVGLFFAGAAAFAGGVHLIFLAHPGLHTALKAPLVLDKSVVYWGLLLAAIIAGGLLVRWHRKVVLEVVTSLIGGVGVAYSLSLLGRRADVHFPGWALILAASASLVAGVLAQRRIRRRGCSRRASVSGET